MTDPQLEELERRYRELAGELARALADIGFVSDGTLLRRFMACGQPRCRCKADPPRPHGPYWQWSRKLAGKTQSRSLSEAEAVRYTEWIANGRRLEGLVAEMREVSREAIDVILGRLRSSAGV